MPPPKSSRNHDDTKSDAATGGAKEKSGSAATSTKMRRVASQTSAAQNREPPPIPKSVPSQTTAEAAAPNLLWSSFDRDVLHAYRQEHHLNVPTSFVSSYHQTLLSKPGSIGLHSPTMARKRHARRQNKDRLALAVRKHFNSMGVQENDVIVDFIYKLRTEDAAKRGVPIRQTTDTEP